MEKTKRYDCEMPGWEDNFIVLSTRWNRQEQNMIVGVEDPDGDEWATLMNSKTVEVHLEIVNSDQPLTDPNGFTAEHIDALFPGVLIDWLANVLTDLAIGLNRLGEAQKRQFYTAWGLLPTEPVAADIQTPEDAPVLSMATDNISADSDLPQKPS